MPRSTALARQEQSKRNAYARVRAKSEEILALRKKHSAKLREIRESKVPQAGMSALAAGGAGLALGALKGATGTEEFAGIPMEAIAATGLLAAGFAAKKPLLIQAAGGPLALWMHEIGVELGERVSSGMGAQ